MILLGTTIIVIGILLFIICIIFVDNLSKMCSTNQLFYRHGVSTQRIKFLLYAFLFILCWLYAVNGAFPRRVGVMIQRMYQLVFPPEGLYESSEEIPIAEEVLNYELAVTNHFVGGYALHLRVPQEGPSYSIPIFRSPHLQQVVYSTDENIYEQRFCRRETYSLGTNSVIFTYQSIVSGIDIPVNKKIRIQVNFPEDAKVFFAKNPGSTLYFRKVSDE